MARANYRLTPARRAAILKAQKISARRRRNQRIRAGAKIAGGILATAAVYGAQAHLNKYASDPRKIGKDYNDLSAFAKRKLGKGRRVDPNAPGVGLKSRKPIRYYGRGRASHIRSHHVMGHRIRSR